MARLIDSGSLIPGVSAVDFDLPPGTALRCERPAEAVRRFICGYFVMDSVSDHQRPGSEWMLPSYAQIWVILSAGPINVGLRRRRYPGVPKAFLLGPSSQAMPITSNGGTTVGIEISPLGWARLVAASAEDVRNRLVPLGWWRADMEKAASLSTNGFPFANSMVCQASDTLALRRR